MTDTVDFPLGRYEHKFLLRDNVATQIRDAMLPHLEIDRHMPEGSVRGYVVHSIYYDSADLDLYRQACENLADRFKLRLRFYDDLPDGIVFVEVKEKKSGKVFKKRYPTNKDLVESWLTDPGSESLMHALSNGARGSALEEFCKRREALRAAPKVLVTYQREAYNSKTDPKVRVTFDRRIQTNAWNRTMGAKVAPYGQNVGGLNVVLEFKYADAPPDWLRDILTRFGLARTSFSKFTHCVDALGISGKKPRKTAMDLK